MRIASKAMLAATALAGVAATAPASARTFVSIGVGAPVYPAYGYRRAYYPAYYPGYYAPYYGPPVVYGGYYRPLPYGPRWGYHHRGYYRRWR